MEKTQIVTITGIRCNNKREAENMVNELCRKIGELINKEIAFVVHEERMHAHIKIEGKHFHESSAEDPEGLADAFINRKA